MSETRVLILDGSIFPDLYHPMDHWRALIDGTPFDAVRLPSGQEVPDPGVYTHVILTGSEASIMEPEAWYHVESQAVRRAIDRGVPMLGSCFGHQMLAKTLSGPRHVRRSPTPELGWASVDIIEDDPLFCGLKNPFNVFVSHFDEVIDPPAPWKIIAKNGQCAVQVMRYGEKPVWGIQSHPEITPGDGKLLLEGFIEKAPEKEGLLRAALAQTPRDDLLAGEIVRRFLDFRS